MLKWINMKKQKEMEMAVSLFFIERLNSNFRFNYKAIPNEDESRGERDVDIYAKSSNEVMLKLQLTTNDAEVMEKTALMNKEYKKGRSVVVLADLTPERCIRSALQRKESHTDKEDVILLIHSQESAQINKDYAKSSLSEFTTSTYKGIFWVLMPSEYSSNPHEGQIIAIKNCFGENCISF